MDFSGKVVLVTGGASGIGACSVEEFLKSGVKGVLIADVSDGQELAQKLNEKYGSGRVTFVKTDVTDENSFDNAFQQAVKQYGNIDILLNCAGLMDEVKWKKLYQVNVIGTVTGCQLAIEKYFPKHKNGDKAYIINIASVIGLTRSFGENKIVLDQGICMLVLCPGLTDTPLIAGLNAETLTYIDLLEAEKSAFVTQSPQAVAKAAVEILEKGESGSVWIIDTNELYQIKLPKYEDLKSLRI
ncbi:short chain dehydrogenase [Popillia japonica]|uniref:Short chain dehydrogenase n=1 Tax=Popillia japonica TaxID=7064 RepID=A0AAW1J041_POPJA